MNPDLGLDSIPWLLGNEQALLSCITDPMTLYGSYHFTAVSLKL